MVTVDRSRAGIWKPSLDIFITSSLFSVEPILSSTKFMRLGALVPSELLPADLVLSLEKVGIRTDTDFLFSGTPAEIFQRLPPGTVSLHELTIYIALVTEKASAPGVCADQLLSLETDSHNNRDEFTCGVPELDALLGGFGGSRVFEISGDKGSGKTVRILRQPICVRARVVEF